MSRSHSLPALALVAALLAPAGARAQDEAGPVRYVAFGDSITEGTDFDEPSRDCPEECGWAPRLEARLEAAGRDVEVRNAGLGGERTEEGVFRIDSVVSNRDDVLLLMEGTNDVSRLVNGQGFSIETMVFNLDRIARKAAQRGVATVHATVIPRVPFASRGDTDNEVTEELNQEIRAMAYNAGRRLADPYEVFLTTPGVFARYYHPPPDPVGHPNPAGFDLLADVFFDVLEGIDSVPPVVGNISPFDERPIAPDTEIRVRLYDFGAGIDTGATELLVDGQPVPATKSGDALVLSLAWRPPEGHSGVVDVGYRTQDRAAPPNAAERQVARYVVRGTTFLTADIDRSGRVDGADLVILARAFGSSNGTFRFDHEADLDKDGTVDGEDLAILASQFGQGE